VTATNSGYSFPGKTKYVDDVTIGDGTGIVSVKSVVKGAEGTVTLTPTDKGSGQLQWKCASADINSKFLPSECR